MKMQRQLFKIKRVCLSYRSRKEPCTRNNKNGNQTGTLSIALGNKTLGGRATITLHYHFPALLMNVP